MSACLQFRDVTLGYDRHPAVHHLDGALAHGSLTAIVGPNGSGKSTLLKGIVGVLRPWPGRSAITTAAAWPTCRSSRRSTGRSRRGSATS